MRDVSELVARLRALGGHGFPNWADDAAAAIEAQAREIAALTARAEAAEAKVGRLVGAAGPLARMFFMDDNADDDDVCIVSAKTIKEIRAALAEIGGGNG